MKNAVVLASLLIVSCCPKTFVMGEYNYPGTPTYTCKAPNETTNGTCTPNSPTNEAAWNQSGTVRAPFKAPLFTDCQNGVQRLLIEDTGKPDTTIVYQCAPPPITVGEAGPAAGPAPSGGGAPAPSSSAAPAPSGGASP